MKSQSGFRTPALLITAISLLVLLTACTHHVVVNINAITDATSTQTGKRYLMTNANEVGKGSELYFQEFRRYFDHLLAKNGYTRVEAKQDADLEIRFRYGVSDGTTGIQHYTWPIYETFGGERVTITERITDSSGDTRTINRTVYIPPQVRQVGTAYEASSYTYYNRYVNLVAFPVAGDGQQQTPAWNLSIYSVGESNDLRAIMPFLAAASEPYLGKNSGQQQSVTLAHDNPLVLELRQLISP